MYSRNKLKKVGLFLGVHPHAGGMFQYAQSILEALLSLDKDVVELRVVYSTPEWIPILKRLGAVGIHLRHAKIGMTIANIFMFLRVPGVLSRKISAMFNPIARELISYKCDLWVFPAQDPLSWQLQGVKTISTIHDLMHRYQPSYPEVGSKLRYGVREHRFSSITKYCDAILVDSEVGSSK